jgi:hypothetical protein
LKKCLAALLLAITPAVAFTQPVVGSGTVDFRFTTFSGPLAIAGGANPYDESS